MDCSLPGFSVRGILQGRILECIAISFSRSSNSVSFSGLKSTERNNTDPTTTLVPVPSRPCLRGQLTSHSLWSLNCFYFYYSDPVLLGRVKGKRDYIEPLFNKINPVLGATYEVFRYTVILRYQDLPVDTKIWRCSSLYIKWCVWVA